MCTHLNVILCVTSAQKFTRLISSSMIILKGNIVVIDLIIHAQVAPKDSRLKEFCRNTWKLTSHNHKKSMTAKLASRYSQIFLLWEDINKIHTMKKFSKVAWNGIPESRFSQAETWIENRDWFCTKNVAQANLTFWHLQQNCYYLPLPVNSYNSRGESERGVNLHKSE